MQTVEFTSDHFKTVVLVFFIFYGALWLLTADCFRRGLSDS